MVAYFKQFYCRGRLAISGPTECLQTIHSYDCVSMEDKWGGRKKQDISGNVSPKCNNFQMMGHKYRTVELT